jgi:hypothetical protein
MTQPDRFKQMVEKVESVVGVSSEGRDTCAVYSRDVVTLLRRQHAACVRMVKSKYPAFDSDAYRRGYSTALTDVLRAMASYKKGRP